MLWVCSRVTLDAQTLGLAAMDRWGSTSTSLHFRLAA